VSRRVARGLWWSVALTACGYRPMYGSSQTPSLVVVGSPATVADVALLVEVESGMRTGLARAGALRDALRAYPRVVVEVLRVDRASEGVVALPGGRRETRVGGLPLAPSLPHSPLARATRVGVVAHAWIEREPGAARERDTGDVRTSETIALEPVAAVEVLRYDDAVRAASRRLGERLARIVLGYPDAADDAM
jgi:hypothetical protein